MKEFLPPDPNPIIILVLAVLATAAKLYWYRQTRNVYTLAEMLARLSIVLIYTLVAIADQQIGFEKIFTNDLWRIFARYGFILLFLVEIIPWLSTITRKTIAKIKK
jgi:hypothetical protein